MTDAPPEAFWDAMWRAGRLGFHQPEVNAHLRDAEAFLTGAGAGRALVPLCGKSLDLVWLRARFTHVVGVEFVETAIAQFFAEQGLTPQETADLGRARFESHGLTLIASDIFHVTPAEVGAVDLVYDRAALIALPPDVRPRYAAHVLSLCRPGTRILLLTMFATRELPYAGGPPFSVDDDEVRALYGAACTLEHEDAGPAAGLPESMAQHGVRASIWRMQVR